ncbi:hypothetical protein [Termitidicoccus mucosus]|uniref:hypothetical protein n=1 Tax=Termitidicoccus mucosus TaxID=1184151 RepID=UPI003182D7DB
MPPLTLHDYRTMPYPERCQRIGELLGLAVVRYFRQQRIAVPARPAEPAKILQPEFWKSVS